MGTSATTPPPAGLAPIAISNGALPRNVEPGQPLRADLGVGAGIDPDAQLAAAARDRAAWAPIGAEPIVRSAIVPSRNAGRAGLDDGTSPNGMASTPPAGDGNRRGTPLPVRGRDATLGRLEREGQRTTRPICANC
ncbi:hypothetical protein MKK88_04695 [Methylobacterium sp. E-005]|uniref:hypothetical protein n=1 Tax=Methylobacterium sp. E-005 TaxID=2836549 RepID=UPI001FBA743A|nr:hypothetical protein [Methylobacterium sp. E-005]MCJ2085294.1 hypothetical protein [Methylobacterium sp. E-005]